MRLIRLGLVIPLSLSFVILAACSTQTKYGWGGYEPALYAYYKNPTEAKALAEALGELLAKDEADGKKVPPGLYAEYAYMQMELGAPDVAITYFKKEKAAWPESAVLMDNMIKSAKIPVKTSDAQ